MGINIACTKFILIYYLEMVVLRLETTPAKAEVGAMDKADQKYQTNRFIDRYKNTKFY